MFFTYLATCSTVMSSASDGELYAAELAHADSTVWQPGGSQVTQGNTVIFLTTILEREGGREGRETERKGNREGEVVVRGREKRDMERWVSKEKQSQRCTHFLFSEGLTVFSRTDFLL